MADLATWQERPLSPRGLSLSWFQGCAAALPYPPPSSSFPAAPPPAPPCCPFSTLLMSPKEILWARCRLSVGRLAALRAPGMFGSAECGPDSWFPWQWYSRISLGLLPGQMTIMTANQTTSSCARSQRGRGAKWGQLSCPSLSSGVQPGARCPGAHSSSLDHLSSDFRVQGEPGLGTKP